MIDNNELTNLEIVGQNKLYVSLLGDKGGTSTKLLLQVLNTESQAHSNRYAKMIGIYEGDKENRDCIPGGYFHIRRLGGGGGLDLVSRSEAKFGARFSQLHQIRGKIWEVLLIQHAKIGKESQFWGHLGLYMKFKRQNLGYLSPIFLETKFGAPT